MPLASEKLSLVAFPVFIHHYTIAELIVLEATLEGPTLMKPIVAQYLLIVLPIPTELISIGISVHSLSVPLPILYPPFVILCL